MMKAGGEDKIIKDLQRAGTLDSEGLPVEGGSPSMKLPEAGNLEEKKD